LKKNSCKEKTGIIPRTQEKSFSKHKEKGKDRGDWENFCEQKVSQTLSKNFIF